MEINKLNLANLSDYNCSRNTVSNVSVPITQGSVFDNIAKFPSDLELDIAPKKSKLIKDVSKNKTPKIQNNNTAKSQNKNIKQSDIPVKEVPVKQLGEKTMMFMGKEMKMSGVEIPGEDGGKEFLYVSDDGHCMISQNYDKDGNILSVSQQENDDKHFKNLVVEYDAETGNYVNRVDTKDRITGERTSFYSRTDKDGNLISERERTEKDGVETTNLKKYKQGELVEESEQYSDGKTLEKVAAKYNKKDNTYQDTTEVMDLKTGEQYSDVVKTDANNNVISQSHDEYKNGVRNYVAEQYDKQGNVVFQQTSHTSAEHIEETNTFRYNEQNNTVTQSKEVINNLNGELENYTQVTDANENLLSESLVTTKNGFREQEYQKYDADGNVVSKRLIQSSPQIGHITLETTLNEQGQEVTEGEYIFKGKVYTSADEYYKAVNNQK